MEQVELPASVCLRIVLIDPHETVRANLAGRLRSDERIASVIEASSLTEASDIIEFSTPHAVVIDPGRRNEPEGTALRTLRLLRKRTPWFLIAIHTSRTERDHTADPSDSAADLVLLKGLRTSDLVGQLIQALPANAVSAQQHS
jgi:DNA-binding NarL/FixJ family response regulator